MDEPSRARSPFWCGSLEPSMREEALSLSFPWGYDLATGRFWLVTGEGGDYRRFASEVTGDTPSLWFWFWFCKYCLVCLGQPVGRDTAWCSWRVGRCLRYVRTEVVFELWILNFVSFLYSGILGVCATDVFLRCIVQVSAGSRRMGEAGDFLVKLHL